MKLWVLVGTRAEYIKLSQLILRFDQRGFQYTLIETGQHFPQTASVRDEFGIRRPDTVIRPIFTRWGMFGKLAWLVLILKDVLIAKRVHDYAENPGNKMAIVQGDTVSTLLGMLLARRHGFRVAHIESGLSSDCIMSPFPEESIRRIVSRFSDLLLAPSTLALDNLAKYRRRKVLCCTGANTGLDACLASIMESTSNLFQRQAVVLVAIHRLENLYVPNKLDAILAVLSGLSKNLRLRFVSYPNTINRIRRSEIGRSLLQNSGVEFIQTKSHSEFLREMLCSTCVVTDGGTIQEECFYLGIHCCILRDSTERPNCLSENMEICKPLERNVEATIHWITEHTSSSRHKSSASALSRAESIARLLNVSSKSPTSVVLDALLDNSRIES